MLAPLLEHEQTVRLPVVCDRRISMRAIGSAAAFRIHSPRGPVSGAANQKVVGAGDDFVSSLMGNSSGGVVAD